MNKKDFAYELKSIRDKYQEEFYYEKIKEKLKELEYGKDYTLVSNVDNKSALTIINTLYKTGFDSLEKAMESLIFNSTKWVFKIDPYKDNGGQVKVFQYSLTDFYGSKCMNIMIYFKFLDKNKYKEFLDLDEQFEKNEIIYFSEFEILELLKHFSKLEVFIDYLEDKEEFQNIYNYFKERL